MTTMQPEQYRRADIVLCHSVGIVPWLIRVFQRLRYRKGDAPFWSHAAMLVAPHPDGDGDWLVVEATARGVQFAYLSSLGEHEVLDAGLDARGRELAAAYAELTLGAHYGFLTIASIVVNLLTPVILQVTRPGTFICSGLVGHSLEHGGYSFPVRWETDEVMPADLAYLFRR
jgi:hypothetical protein